ncbi:E3 SUMO-protein ligase RanBP2-like [Myxocyprinus asiaticus]|uniref:E3 SUMO-protein ligase RanBP2-like n=1 Tax=Myxocyprinus asiaticus TaxID=70543 RepID=UPI0022239169|nr:E3 SUMO-protein ligase RanBP2-like [Myxocyprinus asiaticus]
MTGQGSLRCIICLDLLINPVTIPCGHTFCKDCITGLWEQNDDREDYSCPQCKQTFSQIPRLIKCVVVKELCEKLRKMRTKTHSDGHDVSCDSCTTRRMKAIKSCLTCLASFCDSHTEQHNDLHRWRKHHLIDATDLQSKTCTQHGKLLEFYCHTDQQCICVLCGMNEHKNHDTISAADEREEKQRKLMKTREKFLQKIQDREEDFKELTKVEESVKHSAQSTVAESERIFSEVVSFIQKTSSRVKEVISNKERAELNRIQGLQEKVQEEIADMKMKVSELDQLMPTEDHIQFIQVIHLILPSEVSGSVDGAAETPETVKPAAPTSSFHTQFTEKEDLWVCEKMKSTSQAGLTVMVAKKDRQWVCDVCLVINKGTSSLCDACQTPKPKMKSRTPTVPKVSFACSFNQLAVTGVKASPASLKCESSTTQADKQIKNSTFSFSTLASTGGCKFGNVSSPVPKYTAEQDKNKGTTCSPSAEKTSQDDNPLSINKPKSMSFADLAKSSQSSFQCGKEDVFHFGESIAEFSFSFPCFPKSSSVLNQSQTSQIMNEKEQDGPYFEPLLDLVEISTGEENEQVVFRHRAKLYRYDKELYEWKERGVGDLKILQNYETKRVRLVMRRYQVLKLCANHWITSDMTLKPMKGIEKAMSWRAFDCADGEVKGESLAVRFSLKETANAFEEIFEEAKDAQANKTLLTPFSLRAHAIIHNVEGKPDVVHRTKNTNIVVSSPKFVFGTDIQKIFGSPLSLKEMLSILTSKDEATSFASMLKSLDLSNRPSVETINPINVPEKDEDFETAVKSFNGKLYPDVLVQGDATCHDANVPFENAGAATESQNHGTEEVHLSSSKEDEKILFKEKTKLYHVDHDIGKLKAHGVGDIKILFHPMKNVYHVLMRQEGDIKICANHPISRTIQMKLLKATSNAVVWTATDYTEGDAKVEQFVAKFKTPELAKSFRRTFTYCQSRMMEFRKHSTQTVGVMGLSKK